MTDLILDKYFDYIKEEKKLSDNTVDAYTRDIAQFDEYLENNSSYNLLNTNKTVIITYLSFLQRNGKAVSTISRNLASLRCLYQYLLNNNLIKEDPTFNLKSPKSEKKLPNVLNKDEIELLISQTNIETKKGARDRAMIKLIYSSGLRVSELLDLNIEDLNFDSGLLRLRKDDLNRVFPLDETSLKGISYYLDTYRSDSSDDEPLFTNMHGDRLTRQGIWKIFKQYNKMSGLNKDITPHVLRHSFAIEMLNTGMSLLKLQKILGHSDLSTIQSYQIIQDE
ncbi:MAG TPA: tyrosine-type recombinase/integrase [Tissierellaceae bacterium]|nr:tyrosine-type recombinase/integrase [Tissierellaceae bacterium]